MHAKRSFIACISFWICFVFVIVGSWSVSFDDIGEDIELHRRRERNADPQYTVELFMVIDYAAYKWWYGLADEDTDTEADTMALINQYYSHVFNGIDLRFRSIDDQPYQIDLGLVGIYVAKSENESEWTSGSTVENGGGAKGERLMVNSSEALEKFQTWVDENEALPVFDHAVLFTGTNLTYAGSPGNTGLAFASSMCRNISNSSIVEDTFDFRTITYASQQIARSLGASDDMDNNDCLEFFNYIMTPKLKLPMKKFPSNRWTFSSCSRTYFQEYLDTLNEDDMNCLLNTTLTEKYPPDLADVTEELLGQIYSADEQCVRAHGRGSFVCRNEIKSEYKSVCYGLPCYVPKEETCKLILPSDGTVCGDKKYCMEGKCKTFDDAEELSDSCPYGNSPVVNCSGVYQMASSCYQPLILYDCCAACNNVSLDKEGCEYGDRNPPCTVETCLERGMEYSASSCCLTCEGLSFTTPEATSPGNSLVAPTSTTQSTTQATTVAGNEGTTENMPTTTSTIDLSSTSSIASANVNTNTTHATASTARTAVPGSTDVKYSTTAEMSFLVDSKSAGEDLPIIPSDTETVSASTEQHITLPRSKRSSPMVFTKTVLKTADPLKSPLTVKPLVPNGYEEFVNKGLTRTITASPVATPYQITKETPKIIDVALDSFPTSTSKAALPASSTSASSSTGPMYPAVTGSLPTTVTSTKTNVAGVSAAPTKYISTGASNMTGAALPTIPKTTSISTQSPSTSILATSPSTTTCQTQPEKEWDRNLSALNRQFFSKLAINMKIKERQVLLETYRKLKHMYRDITTTLQERMDAGELMGSNSDYPSFDNSDILRLIGPIWRRNKKDMIISLSSKIKLMRYQILAMTKSYLTRKRR